ncbi:universal stress protein [Sphingomicrobium sp. XHP0235]|uniref:universal stress protein n=1 Tax=Sphingomicrobium aquimarinum TaxID=3133971 RepID=UPI0031FEFD02
MSSDPILVASDLTPRSDRALERGLALGTALKRDVCLVHVPELEKEESGREELEKLVGKVVPPNATLSEFIFPEGIAPKAIAACAEQRHAAMIVMGVARYNSIGDYFLGTAVEYVIRNTHRPVLIVKERAFEHYSDIIVPTDFSDASRQAIEVGARLFPGSTLHIVHSLHLPWSAWVNDPRVEEELKQEASVRMASLIKDLDIPDQVRSAMTSRVVAEPLYHCIMGEAEKYNAHLALLGSHGASGIRAATIGSVAAELVDSLPLDTVVVDPRG